MDGVLNKDTTFEYAGERNEFSTYDMIMESAEGSGQENHDESTGEDDEPEKAEQVFEGSETEILESAAAFESAGHAKQALYTVKAGGMSAVLEWLSGKDFSYDTLDVIIAGVADVDFDGDISDDEEKTYNQILGFAADVMVRFGADPKGVAKFFNDEDDEEGKKIGDYIVSKMDGIKRSDNELISGYADSDSFVFECAEDDEGFEAAFEAAQKVIRDGKVVLKKKRLRKKKLSAAQKAALKKARRKANSAAAKAHRKKSMRERKKRGM